MVAKVHFLIRDEDGNLQDVYLPCVLESENSLTTTMGIITPKALEGMIVDTTSVRDARDIFERWYEMIGNQDIDPKPVPNKSTSKHGKECFGYHGARPAGARNGEDYCISVSINESYRTIGIFHRNDLVAELPIRYCPFCGQML